MLEEGQDLSYSLLRKAKYTGATAGKCQYKI